MIQSWRLPIDFSSGLIVFYPLFCSFSAYGFRWGLGFFPFIFLSCCALFVSQSSFLLWQIFPLLPYLWVMSLFFYCFWFFSLEFSPSDQYISYFGYFGWIPYFHEDSWLHFLWTMTVMSLPPFLLAFSTSSFPFSLPFPLSFIKVTFWHMMSYPFYLVFAIGKNCEAGRGGSHHCRPPPI